MRFPLRLTADLTLGLAVRSLRLKRKRPLILNLLASGNANSYKSPIVWIGGHEPLNLPETPRVVNFLAAAGRHVFLPTTGLLLRRRIHEFQPSQRLHLTIRFDGAETSHDQRVGQRGAFRDALESVRTAKLSGFFLCAQLVLHSPREATELEHLHGELINLDFDGYLISLAAPASASHELRRSISDLRKRLLSRRWALLSTLLDSVVSPSVASVVNAQHPSPRLPRERAPQLPPRGREESVQAP
ncbi:MAG: hypothetical protein ABSH13_20555 [Candidatus Acidiferrum sp.]|jgi:MoaA/NifB/PqqE/SkfB family radical SAM enzyme